VDALRFIHPTPDILILINEKRHSMKNPCQDLIMVKAFKGPRMKQKDILSRESVDEIIYRSKKEQRQADFGTSGKMRHENRRVPVGRPEFLMPFSITKG